MLQPSLSGNARISVICTVNPDTNAVTESLSTLLFAQRVKRVRLDAKKKEVVDTDALLQRYKKEIAELKQKLAEREAEPVKSRRLSAREVSNSGVYPLERWINQFFLAIGRIKGNARSKY